MDRRLAEAEYLAGPEYSIADVATFPWTMPRQREMHRIDIAHYPNVARWGDTVAARPAVQRGIALLADSMKVGDPTEQAYDNMFGGTQFQR
jgi:GST-like protein